MAYKTAIQFSKCLDAFDSDAQEDRAGRVTIKRKKKYKFIQKEFLTSVYTNIKNKNMNVFKKNINASKQIFVSL